MGYDERRLEVVAAVSRHNSVKDHRHDMPWEELTEIIKFIVGREKYKEIRAWVV